MAAVVVVLRVFNLRGRKVLCVPTTPGDFRVHLSAYRIIINVNYQRIKTAHYDIISKYNIIYVYITNGGVHGGFQVEPEIGIINY